MPPPFLGLDLDQIDDQQQQQQQQLQKSGMPDTQQQQQQQQDNQEQEQQVHDQHPFQFPSSVPASQNHLQNEVQALFGDSMHSLDNLAENQLLLQQAQQLLAGDGDDDMEDDESLEVTPDDLFPPGYAMSERPSPDSTLTVHHAIWFLNVLERSNMEQLAPDGRERIEKSTLRAKPKHRTAVLFEDDVRFVLESSHSVVPETSVIAMCTAPNAAAAAAAASSNLTRRPSARNSFSGDNSDVGSRQRLDAASSPAMAVAAKAIKDAALTEEVDIRMVLIRQACKDVIGAYEQSIRNAPPRSCIWSALMHRAEFHLRESGFSDTQIIESDNPKQESMLELQGHRISRSNFTKIARQFCENWNNDGENNLKVPK
ncbi:Hypothetical Protein FCC1311_088222 [Hondaea fermentalgiana]|uniref:Uncharacterized protein n=1 Tax=Hondaea fermentalgiana TaxID=2315210 RepID=A0A2R5GP05_9STRA|nr:Hypothetical Protein FCC1311_088222 [Hondaea fermentalgiana]|eukprot:GBG32597.1 Hypothetical Protein FCC1311_088222 [Hondaea fermentalgiana]